ncbi:R3H domain-containing nucleic acid-binding protein [Vulgatibacter incomptus]|uniref:R3H domain-containing nucleic acid-binding protein n=1 Tax=Vulgatibacter incomptus TaxID=1391653 RepID=UPI000AA14E6C|nr:R3H domain-containing nucleic acid-binding protein [Vulgatibacter incomptus]
MSTASPDDLSLLVAILPESLRRALEALPAQDLLELVMDLGRPPEARFPERTTRLSAEPVDQAQLDHVVSRVGVFGGDNRAGIERTLHRISAIRNRQGRIVGLTLRAGRAVLGTVEALRDLVESGLNILLLGRPGVGKTTKLREVARVLADELDKRVIVIDTSNEIGGDGDIPHPGIGASRRMQVPHPDRQHAVMIEAVENHMPEAIIVDEIGTVAEAAASRTIAERGVQLVATAHGNTLENLVMNPTLSDVVGGVHTVTLSDEEARRRGTPKTISERRSLPTFDIVVEMVSWDEVVVHRDTAAAVDRLLAGRDLGGERRRIGEDGSLKVEELAPSPAPERPVPAPEAPPAPRRGPARIHFHALSRDLGERVIRELRLDARIVDKPESADLVLVLKARAGDPRIRRVAEKSGVRIYPVKRNGSSPIRRALQDVFQLVQGLDEEEVRDAVEEAEHAIRRVMAEGIEISLSPRRPSLRRLQHRMVTRYALDAESVGSEPARHLVIHPG